jgi:glucose/arabinose dehydrogenase
MVRSIAGAAVCVIVAAGAAQSPTPQTTTDPFPPLEAVEGVIAVRFQEFATLPDVNNAAPRMMTLVEDPASKRLFISAMTGQIFTVGASGTPVATYLDIGAPQWNMPVQAQGAERGLQSFTLHPQFAQRGTPGYGRLYTYLDTSNTTPAADFTTPGKRTHDTVLLEWTAKDAAAATYDGGPPRELFRAAQPFGNHNAGHIAFNPLSKAGMPDFGLLYVGFADGGSGGDPFNLSQEMTSVFGKILRIDPLGNTSRNGRYGIPPSNPFVKQRGAAGEIYASGVRNPQRFSWDPKTGTMYVADIGQNVVEEISPVTAGANLGWNKWEGSYAYVDRAISLEKPRSEDGMTWPVVEFDHTDPILQRQVAVTGVYVYRHSAIPQLTDHLIYGDIPSGEVFRTNATALPRGGPSAVHRVLFVDADGARKTLLQLIQDKAAAQGRKPPTRADLRMGLTDDGRLFILNKRDGVVRLIVR